MTIRTTRTLVTFRAPFVLKGLGEQPAGTYEVDTDEEVMEGNEQTAYRRVATLLYLTSGGTTRTCTIDPHELEAALAKDGASPASSAGGASEALRRSRMTQTSTKALISARVDDTPVYDGGGHKLGTLYSFHIDRHRGQVEYAVISFGGLLGLGQSYHPIPFPLLRVNAEKGGYTIGIDKTVLDGGPSYRPDNAPQWGAEYADRIDSYYSKYQRSWL